MLSNTNRPPAEGSFCSEKKNALQKLIVESCNKHMQYSVKVLAWQASVQWVYIPSIEDNFFPFAGPYNIKQLGSVIFLWGSLFALRFEISYGKTLDRRSGNRCNKTWVPAVPALDSQRKQSVLSVDFAGGAWSTTGYWCNKYAVWLCGTLC